MKAINALYIKSVQKTCSTAVLLALPAVLLNKIKKRPNCG